MGADSGVSAEHVASVQRDLNDNGVDAYRGATQLALVPPPVEIKDAGQSTVRRGEGSDRAQGQGRGSHGRWREDSSLLHVLCSVMCVCLMYTCVHVFCALCSLLLPT